MFRYMKEPGKLRRKYSCKFPNCWRTYYRCVGSEVSFVNIHFYSFPRQPDLRKTWADICRVPEEHCASFYICENHFLEEDFMNNTRHRLKPGMVPKHLELVPYITVHCVSDSGINSNQTFQKNINEGSGVVHGTLASSCMSPVPSTSRNLQRGILGTGVRKSHLSPKKSRMYAIHRNTMVRMTKLKKSLDNERRKLHVLKRLYESEKFNYVEENLNKVTLSFINSQLRNAQRAPSGRRWTADDKVFALSMYKRSPRLYRYLSVQFSLPSIRLLKVMLSKVPFEPGLNNAVRNVLLSEVKKMKEVDKFCTLLLDEMSLDKGLHYEPDKQVICGYEDLGHLGRSSKKANHALVFMLRGLRKTWKQVIAYYFTTNTISSTHLKVLICHIIGEIQKIGLKIVCTVCDQGSTNQRAVKALCKESGDGSGFYFFVNEEAIAVVFDVPHLLKNTRNALIEHKIVFQPHKEAKFQYIEEMFNYDQRNPIKVLPKLKKEYFNFKDSFIKMKVKVAAAQLSHTVAAVIETYVGAGMLPSEASYTAQFVEKIDDLFDSLNSYGHFPHDYKKFRYALSEGSPHIKMWYEMLKEMANWKIIELATGKDKTQSFSFLDGWQTTIRSIMFVWKKLKKEGFMYLNTRGFNQDPLENLFCCIRQHGVGNTNPTCFQFKAALKTAVLNNMALVRNNLSNCEDDECSVLSNLSHFVSGDVACQSTVSSSSGETVDRDVCSIPECNLTSDSQALAYVAGYVLKKVGVDATIECQECKICLFSPEILQSHLFTTFKEQNREAPRLMYASENVMLLLQNIHDQLYAFLNNYGHNSALEDTFISIFRMPDSVMVCPKHAMHTAFIKKCVPFFIYKYVRDIKNESQKRTSTVGHDKKVKKFRSM